MPRKAEITRKTNETHVSLSLDLDGAGRCQAKTGVGFIDHMLDLFARHSRADLTVSAKGDLYVDAHHTIEDIGIVLGQAIDRAAGEKRGINRYGFTAVPMDESLAQVVIDLSGRASFVFHAKFSGPLIGTDFPSELIEEFFKSIATNARMNLHITVPYGSNNHHIAEAIFKAFARALRQACAIDAAASDEVPSTKGTLSD